MRYEDVLLNRVLEIEKMLIFLKYEVDHDIVVKKLSEDFKVFHRNHSYKFEHYTKLQQNKVNNIILKTLRFFKSFNKNDNIMFLLKKYLRS